MTGVQTCALPISLELKAKVLYGNIPKAMELLREIAMTSDFRDEKRLLEIVSEGQSQMQSQMASRGDRTALNRALAYGSVSGAVRVIYFLEDLSNSHFSVFLLAGRFLHFLYFYCKR